LGDIKNPLVDGVLNEDGSYTFTNVASLQSNTPAVFSLNYNGANYTGTYKGMASIKLSVDGKLGKLAVNGRVILQLNNEADIFLTVSGNVVNAIIEGCVHSLFFLL
jgi:hypothetical protein